MVRKNTLGEAQISKDGVLDGWCWAPDRPDERVTVEILINGAVAASVVASRFREDLRHLKYGDGYHGFVIPIGQQAQAAREGAVLAAREQVSGDVFWQKLRGVVAIPPGFEARVAALAAGLDAAAAGPAWRARAPLAAFGARSAILGNKLQEAGTSFCEQKEAKKL
jgi:hypothetical protein